MVKKRQKSSVDDRGRKITQFQLLNRQAKLNSLLLSPSLRQVLPPNHGYCHGADHFGVRFATR